MHAALGPRERAPASGPALLGRRGRWSSAMRLPRNGRWRAVDSAAMSLLSSLRRETGPSGFGYASTAEEVVRSVDLRGQTWLVTGVTSGLGKESARVLSLKGARVLGTGRSEARARTAAEELAASALTAPVPLVCELSEPASIRACVATVLERENALDGILCNAGVMALPSRTLVCGQEAQFFTNHIAHFMLVQGLMPRLAPKARVVVVSSSAHRRAPSGGIAFDDLSLSETYRPWRAYGHSKLANLLFARALAQRFEGTERRANAVHPGVIATKLMRHMPPVLRGAMPVASRVALKTAAEGAATQIWAAVHPGAAQLSGEYLVNCNVGRSSRSGSDATQAERLWKATQDIVDAL